MIIRVALITVLLAITGQLSAQDMHFSQFYASPLTLNPALTGAFDGRYRVGAIYRDQWRGVLEKPFTSFAGSMEFSFPMEVFSTLYKDRASIGLLFSTDDVNGIDFTTNQLALSGAFHKSLDLESKQFLSLGFQLGLAQRSINYEDLIFGDQFNGVDGYDLATTEELPENNFSYSDFSVGLNYTVSPKKRMVIYAGVALHHVFEPQVSFFATENTNELTFGDSPLFRKISGQLSFQLPMGDRIFFLPRVLFDKQGPHLRINTGANFRFLLNNYNSTALHLGSWVRPVTNENNDFFVDAVVMFVGLEYSNVLLGISYDATLSDIMATGRQGALEISVAYLGSYDNETILCPKF